MADDNTGDAVVIERSFDAPIELIWAMWTDPDHFKEWYGPDGASIPVAKMDVRVGGSRLVCGSIAGVEHSWRRPKAGATVEPVGIGE